MCCPTSRKLESTKLIVYFRKVLKYLNGPLTFHNNPPSLLRPRHRNRHVTSQVFVDANGQEHMIMTFYIQGRPEGAAPLPSEIGYYEASTRWMQEKLEHLPDLSLDEAMRWTKDQAECAWERSKQTFKYLSGAPVIPPPFPSAAEPEKQAEKPEETQGWSVAGMFSSLKGSRGSSGSFTRTDYRTFTEAEVHADLVRVGNTSRHEDLLQTLKMIHRIMMVISSSGIC